MAKAPLKRPERQSESEQEGSTPLLDSSPIVQLMEKSGIPLTMEIYLALAYPDRVPEEMADADLPELPKTKTASSSKKASPPKATAT